MGWDLHSIVQGQEDDGALSLELGEKTFVPNNFISGLYIQVLCKEWQEEMFKYVNIQSIFHLLTIMKDFLPEDQT